MQHKNKGDQFRQCHIIVDALQKMKIDTEPLCDGEVHGAICDRESQSAFLYTITPSDRSLHIYAYRKFPISAEEGIEKAKAAVVAELAKLDAPCSRWKVFVAPSGGVPCLCMETSVPLGRRDWEAADLLGRKLQAFFACVRAALPHVRFARF
jgi:hypothetical protein